ncbi:MAG TPA: Gfo/Idh/MocA family oxidoreductase [Methanoregulaceae archaeon]|nr:Gfo/Idh/MocA family oxidoreductase [Methanoregulaceae archaeon]HQJ87770.1 Gfo/Idh/MocA family oxidoreductase [Methanoregulaceae archaeon]
MRVGVIGAGVMGKNHVRVLSELRSVDEVLVCDLNRDAAVQTAADVGATVAPTLEGLLDGVDAVSICVPTPHHLAVAERVASAGVPMLVEKPVCASLAEGERLLESVPRGLVAGVGQIERFNPVVGEVARLVSHPLYVEMKRHNPASSRIEGTSVVEDLMIHDIDILANVLFPGVSCRISAAGDSDICSALFAMGACHAHISASRRSSKKIRSLYIEEEGLTIEGDFMTQEVYVYRKPDRYSSNGGRYVQENIIEKLLVNRVEPLRVELQAFLAAVSGGPAFPVTLAEGVENLRIADAIRAAL